MQTNPNSQPQTPRQDSAHSRAPGFIDVKRLIQELSDEDLLQSADGYFASMTPTSEQCFKPFSNPASAVYLTRHLGLVLEAADLFRGARVLDFGCATGWLTKGLAQMGCEAVGVDISQNALRLAEDLKATRPKANGEGTLEFTLYDGHRLPLADESVDRIVCFDAFHHVRDQKATLAEFGRVLKQGGRAAFSEPGPNHSKAVLSQAEMANFNVIENDVCMEEISQYATDAGFTKPQMLIQFAEPFSVDVDDYNAWARLGIGKDFLLRAMNSLQQNLTSLQCFFLIKGDPASAERDSRRADGLAAKIMVSSARRVPVTAGHGLELEVVVRNIGTRHWIAANMAGQVNLGIQLLAMDGRILNNDYGRLRLPRGLPIAPGQEVVITGTIALPEPSNFQLRLDMVAELVAWFGNLGLTQPAIVKSTEL